MSRALLECTYFVSNDSGPMHIASALGIPVLALFAPTDAFTHLPLRKTTAALALDRACAPCEVKDHPFFASGGCRCIAEISAAAVEEEVLKRTGAIIASGGAGQMVPSGRPLPFESAAQ